MRTNKNFHFIVNTIAVFIIFSICTIQSLSQEYWIRQASPTSTALFKCFFTDSLNGWASGDSGVIVHTSNAGGNWVLQRTGLNYAITDLFFINSSTGWGIANDFFYHGTTMLYTSNGGNNWIYSRYPDTSVVLNTIYFIDGIHGFMGGYDGVLTKSSDGGQTWFTYRLDTINLFSHFPIRKFSFLTPQVGLACGGIMDIAGLVWKTTNSGLNWQVRDTTPEPLYDIKFLNAQKSFSTGGDFEYGASIAASTNTGVDWIYNSTGYFGQGMAIAFRTQSEFWVPLGFSTRWMVSYDTGNTWLELFSPDTNAVYDALFVDSMRGWAVGLKGAIYKFNTDLIGIHPGENNVPVSVMLFQNYPNPFNPATTISFDLSRSAMVRITLFDVLGREVKLIYNGFRSGGMNTIHFDASGLSSGVYFYKLETGSLSITKKMVVLK